MRKLQINYKTHTRNNNNNSKNNCNLSSCCACNSKLRIRHEQQSERDSDIRIDNRLASTKGDIVVVAVVDVLFDLCFVLLRFALQLQRTRCALGKSLKIWQIICRRRCMGKGGCGAGWLWIGETTFSLDAVAVPVVAVVVFVVAVVVAGADGLQ